MKETLTGKKGKTAKRKSARKPRHKRSASVSSVCSTTSSSSYAVTNEAGSGFFGGTVFATRNKLVPKPASTRRDSLSRNSQRHLATPTGHRRSRNARPSHRMRLSGDFGHIAEALNQHPEIIEREEEIEIRDSLQRRRPLSLADASSLISSHAQLDYYEQHRMPSRRLVAIRDCSHGEEAVRLSVCPTTRRHS